MNKKELRFSELADNVKIEDLPPDTVLVLDDSEPELNDDFWED